MLHHTECGITRLHEEPTLLASYLGVEVDGLAAKAIDDPYASVTVDVAALRADTRFPGVTVTGLVYDVANGVVTTIAVP